MPPRPPHFGNLFSKVMSPFILGNSRIMNTCIVAAIIIRKPPKYEQGYCLLPFRNQCYLGQFTSYARNYVVLRGEQIYFVFCFLYSNCDTVILPRVGDDIKGKEQEFCPRCECKYESRNTTIIKVCILNMYENLTVSTTMGEK